MFHAGQHVVCVDVGKLRPTPLELGRVYTVKGHFIAMMPPHTGAVGLYLYEVAPPASYVAFNAKLFRPLSSTRLDVFRQLLVSPKERVGA